MSQSLLHVYCNMHIARSQSSNNHISVHCFHNCRSTRKTITNSTGSTANSTGSTANSTGSTANSTGSTANSTGSTADSAGGSATDLFALSRARVHEQQC
jgi:hypothetical protein